MLGLHVELLVTELVANSVDRDGGKRVWFELAPAEEGEPDVSAGLPSGSGGDGREDSDRSTKESSR